MQLSGQQWSLKNININGATTGISAGGFNLVIVDSQFQNVATGIDASGISGALTVIDSSGSSLGTLISGSSSGSAGNSIVLDNVQNSGNTVTLDRNVVLSGSVSQTWVYGDLVSG
jgi:glucan 1,3-beta-glucosidase